jgi:hypothetical protein
MGGKLLLLGELAALGLWDVGMRLQSQAQKLQNDTVRHWFLALKSKLTKDWVSCRVACHQTQASGALFDCLKFFILTSSKRLLASSGLCLSNQASTINWQGVTVHEKEAPILQDPFSGSAKGAQCNPCERQRSQDNECKFAPQIKLVDCAPVVTLLYRSKKISKVLSYGNCN